MATWTPLAGDTGSTLTHLQGSLSGTTADADQLAALDSDGRPYLPRYDLSTARLRLTHQALSERHTGGLWRWRELLPVRRWEHVATLGEGGIPLLDAPRLGRALGLGSLALKAESLNPTGSFKARGMAVAVSRAVELGARRLVAPSAGNAAGALAPPARSGFPPRGTGWSESSRRTGGSASPVSSRSGTRSTPPGR
jgi:threonine synthase